MRGTSQIDAVDAVKEVVAYSLPLHRPLTRPVSGLAFAFLVALSGCAGKSERVSREGASLETHERSDDADVPTDPDVRDPPGSDRGDDEPADDEPTDDEPTDDEPADDEPTDDEPAVHYDRSREGTCARWNADTRERGEGSWDGDLRSCSAGTISEQGRANALRHVNLYRWLADLPPVSTSADRNELAQSCALLQDANWRRAGLSHDPPRSWQCFSEAGARGALTSNISAGPGVVSIAAYFLEIGNEAAMGHRRIILSNELGPIGLGSTGPGGASCMQALPGTQNAARAWVAWPPPGVFPLAAYAFGRRSLSETGWSLQSDYLDLREARVSVSSRGRELDVEVDELDPSPGSLSAIGFKPDGWNVRPGETYAVRVTGIRPSIAYEVEIVDCGE